MTKLEELRHTLTEILMENHPSTRPYTHRPTAKGPKRLLEVGTTYGKRIDNISGVLGVLVITGHYNGAAEQYPLVASIIYPKDEEDGA